MKILIVDDKKENLYLLERMIRKIGYEVVMAEHGKQALEALSNLETPPDLIISDIMMPVMDGYDFFQTVSENPKWINIPFIFLSAKTDPEDVRFGKKLGVDDYITKPFEVEDLLASISGKIDRSKKTRLLSQQIEENLLTSLKIDLSPSILPDEKENVFLFLMTWDEIIGPKLVALSPTGTKPPFDLQSVGSQLFQTTVSVYGHRNYYQAEGVLLKIANIKRDGFIFFDTIDDNNVRGGKRIFMLVSLAPKINYLESLRIKEIFEDIATQLKEGRDWHLEKYWNQISDILVTPPLELA